MSEYGKGKIGKWIEDNPEEFKDARKKATAASAESRKKKKLLREYLSALLETKTETGNYYDDITIALVNQALEGNTKAYEIIKSTLGQDDPKQIEVATNTIKINIGE